MDLTICIYAIYIMNLNLCYDSNLTYILKYFKIWVAMRRLIHNVISISQSPLNSMDAIMIAKMHTVMLLGSLKLKVTSPFLFHNNINKKKKITKTKYHTEEERGYSYTSNFLNIQET